MMHSPRTKPQREDTLTGMYSLLKQSIGSEFPGQTRTALPGEQYPYKKDITSFAELRGLSNKDQKLTSLGIGPK